MTKIMSNNLAWGLVIFGGFIECFWVSGLKYADSFLLYAMTAFGILLSFCCMIIAVKRIEVSVAYAVFVGIGTAGVVVAEMLVFKEPFSLLKISLIALLLSGVIGLKLVSKDKDEKSGAEKLANELGLDEISNKLEELSQENLQRDSINGAFVVNNQSQNLDSNLSQGSLGNEPKIPLGENQEKQDSLKKDSRNNSILIQNLSQENQSQQSPFNKNPLQKDSKNDEFVATNQSQNLDSNLSQGSGLSDNAFNENLSQNTTLNLATSNLSQNGAKNDENSSQNIANLDEKLSQKGEQK